MSLLPEPNAYASPRAPSASQVVSMATAWSLVAAFAGGLGCGWCISHFGEFGALSLAACGALAGRILRKITGGPSKAGGILVVLADCVMFFVAETCWIHWNTEKGEANWWTAITLWPVFIREWQLSALMGAVFAGYGAWCAYGYATSPTSPPARTAPHP